jgi:hypothetical protein
MCKLTMSGTPCPSGSSHESALPSGVIMSAASYNARAFPSFTMRAPFPVYEDVSAGLVVANVDNLL